MGGFKIEICKIIEEDILNMDHLEAVVQGEQSGRQRPHMSGSFAVLASLGERGLLSSSQHRSDIGICSVTPVSSQSWVPVETLGHLLQDLFSRVNRLDPKASPAMSP